MLALLVKIPAGDVASTKDPQFFRGFQTFRGLHFATPLPTSPLVTPILEHSRQPYW